MAYDDNLLAMTTTVSSKGQTVLPVELRQQDHIRPGQEFEVERVEPGASLLKLRPPPRNEGLGKLLLACPVKGWFRPLERTETTDHLPAPRLG